MQADPRGSVTMRARPGEPHPACRRRTPTRRQRTPSLGSRLWNRPDEPGHLRANEWRRSTQNSATRTIARWLWLFARFFLRHRALRMSQKFDQVIIFWPDSGVAFSPYLGISGDIAFPRVRPANRAGVWATTCAGATASPWSWLTMIGNHRMNLNKYLQLTTEYYDTDIHDSGHGCEQREGGVAGDLHNRGHDADRRCPSFFIAGWSVSHQPRCSSCKTGRRRSRGARGVRTSRGSRYVVRSRMQYHV